MFKPSVAEQCLPVDGSAAQSQAQTLILYNTRRPLRGRVARWASAMGFSGKDGQVLLVPNSDGRARGIVAITDRTNPWDWAKVAQKLPAGLWCLPASLPKTAQEAAGLGFALNAYRFTSGKRAGSTTTQRLLMITNPEVRAQVLRRVQAIFQVRNLVNLPAESLGPADLQTVVEELGAAYQAKTQAIIGDDLLKQGFPLIHTVGRAVDQDLKRAPRLLRLDWVRAEHQGDGADLPLLALVGKGVCFDTGGLSLKNSSGMRFMKKDMGGAAHAIALARLVMSAQLPLRLLLLVPAVENVVSGGAFRPGDVFPSRAGLTVEIGNTDAEGRLVLADAITLATEEKPDLLVDFATLTGAARVALGTDLPAVFAKRDVHSDRLRKIGFRLHDPVWPMPLFSGYDRMVDSTIADINNAPASGYGGAITAALFLRRFVGSTANWVHLDLMAYNQKSSPGHPEGGEAQGLRAMEFFVQEWCMGMSAS